MFTWKTLLIFISYIKSLYYFNIYTYMLFIIWKVFTMHQVSAIDLSLIGLFLRKMLPRPPVHWSRQWLVVQMDFPDVVSGAVPSSHHTCQFQGAICAYRSGRLSSETVQDGLFLQCCRTSSLLFLLVATVAIVKRQQKSQEGQLAAYYSLMSSEVQSLKFLSFRRVKNITISPRAPMNIHSR